MNYNLSVKIKLTPWAMYGKTLKTLDLWNQKVDYIERLCGIGIFSTTQFDQK